MIEGYSSLPPNPPPVSAWTTCACSSSRPSDALQRLVDVVRALERAVDGDAAVLARDGDHRVVLDVELLLVADPVLALEDEVGRGERRRRGRRTRSRSGRRRGRSTSGSKTGGSGVGPDRDGAAGRAERLAIRRGEEDERLGVVLDLAADRDEDRLVVADQADDVVAGDVGRGDDGDLRPVEGGIEVERRRTGRGRRSSGSSRRTRRPGRRGRRRTSPRRSAWRDPRGGAARAAAGTAGRDRAGLDDDGVGRRGPGRQLGQGPSSWRLTLSPAMAPESALLPRSAPRSGPDPTRGSVRGAAPRMVRSDAEPRQIGRVSPLSVARFIGPRLIEPRNRSSSLIVRPRRGEPRDRAAPSRASRSRDAPGARSGRGRRPTRRHEPAARATGASARAVGPDAREPPRRPAATDPLTGLLTRASGTAGGRRGGPR